MTGAELSAAFAAAGAAGWGHVAYERLLPAMSREARDRSRKPVSRRSKRSGGRLPVLRRADAGQSLPSTPGGGITTW